MSFNIKEMVYALTIAREKSITKAAKELHMNQSSLNRCIKRMEEELGTTVFRKTREGLVPTLVGEAYLSAAKDIVEMEVQLKRG